MDEKAAVFRSLDPATALPGRDGAYDRERCNVRMEKDIAKSTAGGIPEPIRYCRRCEFACPVGK
jgi:epoxyqueuosine reductase